MSRGKRKSGFKLQKTNILIVCEGETEEIYLNKLNSIYRLKTVKVKVKNAEGGSPKKIYEVAKKEVEYKNRCHATKYEEVYCVFDNDNKDMETELLPALNGMLVEKYIPIYSNISFELWLYLHHDETKVFYDPGSVERALKKFDPDYHKTKYDVDSYIKNISKAEKSSSKLMEKNSLSHPKEAKHLSINPYTNISLLIKRLEEEHNK